MEEKMIETFILTILLLYILIGCWIEDMAWDLWLKEL